MNYGLLSIVFLFLTIWFFASCFGYSGKIEKGNKTIVKIEKFRNEKNRLPDSLLEIGIAETESGPIYYKKQSESNYILWFGKGLGESAVYDSDTKQWK